MRPEIGHRRGEHGTSPGAGTSGLVVGQTVGHQRGQFRVAFGDLAVNAAAALTSCAAGGRGRRSGRAEVARHLVSGTPCPEHNASKACAGPYSRPRRARSSEVETHSCRTASSEDTGTALPPSPTCSHSDVTPSRSVSTASLRAAAADSSKFSPTSHHPHVPAGEHVAVRRAPRTNEAGREGPWAVPGRRRCRAADLDPVVRSGHQPIPVTTNPVEDLLDESFQSCRLGASNSAASASSAPTSAPLLISAM